MSKFRPLADRVLVKPDSTPERKSGLAVPKGQEEEPVTGIVVAAGPKAEKVITYVGPALTEYGGNVEGIIIGEHVQWARYAGREVMHEGKKHRLLRLEEIDLVIEED